MPQKEAAQLAETWGYMTQESTNSKDNSTSITPASTLSVVSPKSIEETDPMMLDIVKTTQYNDWTTYLPTANTDYIATTSYIRRVSL
jgi:hypothetical protein